MRFPSFFLALIYFVGLTFMHAQEEDYEEEIFYEDVSKDPSKEGQWAFVQELLYTAGFMPDKVEIYQSLPNNARVYRITLDSITGGFLFVRWDKEKKEHYISNKMINPGWYYNLKAAREIMRKQTNKASFSKEDMALQAEDQIQITPEELEEIRSVFNENQFIKDSIASEQKKLELEKIQKKEARKEGKKN